MELIQSFWNSPGFLGIGITQVRGETYLYLNPQSIDWQKKTLLQLDLHNDVQNFVEFYPRMKSCQLEIMGYTANVLKLDDDLVISVLSQANANIPPIDELRPIADRLDEAINLLIYFSQNNVRMPTLSKKRKVDKSTFTFSRTTSDREKFDPVAVARKIPEIVEVKEIIEMLTRLIKFSSQYLGKKIVVNYLQATRPQFQWLQNFVISAIPIIPIGLI